jgi:hypothetical protein
MKSIIFSKSMEEWGKLVGVKNTTKFHHPARQGTKGLRLNSALEIKHRIIRECI